MKTFIKECRWGQFILIRGDMISQYVDMYGEWAEPEVDLFKILLPSNGICVEVGANIGMHSVPLSRICPDGVIVCFEPQRPIFYTLCGNITINNRLNVVARRQAVGERNETLEIELGDYEIPWNYGSFSLTSGYSREGQFAGTTTRDIVESIALDDDREVNALPRIDLIKIDAEGFEPSVLRGASNLISRHRPDIFVEANESETASQIMELMRSHGYVGYWFVGHRFRADNFNRSPFRINAWDSNIIFRPPERPPLPRDLVEVKNFGDLARGVPIIEKYP